MTVMISRLLASLAKLRRRSKMSCRRVFPFVSFFLLCVFHSLSECEMELVH